MKGWEIYYLMGASLAILVLVIMMPSGLTPAIEGALRRLGVNTAGRAKSGGR